MIEERILLDKELDDFNNVINNCLILEGLKPTKKILNIFYDYVRLNEEMSLHNPKAAFFEVLNNKASLKYFEVNSFDEILCDYGGAGKDNYIKIRILEMELFIRKNKLYISHLGKNF